MPPHHSLHAAGTSARSASASSASSSSASSSRRASSWRARDSSVSSAVLEKGLEPRLPLAQRAEALAPLRGARAAAHVRVLDQREHAGRRVDLEREVVEEARAEQAHGQRIAHAAAHVLDARLARPPPRRGAPPPGGSARSQWRRSRAGVSASDRDAGLRRDGGGKHDVRRAGVHEEGRGHAVVEPHVDQDGVAVLLVRDAQRRCCARRDARGAADGASKVWRRLGASPARRLERLGALRGRHLATARRRSARARLRPSSDTPRPAPPASSTKSRRPESQAPLAEPAHGAVASARRGETS